MPSGAVAIVREASQIVDGDQLIAVIAESWHRRGKLAGGGFVATVMSNLGLERYLQGLAPSRTAAVESGGQGFACLARRTRVG